MSGLFSPLALRGVVLRNRVMISPMCQYSADDGVAGDWHLVHLGARAAGGAGLVCAEATAVAPEGRISCSDTGLWDDRHVEPFARIVRFCRSQGAAVAVQLAHAGRKASTAPPWTGGGAVPASAGGWAAVAPSAVAFGALPAPRALSAEELPGVVRAFRAAAARARGAGFDAVELHAAHGYLLHQFLSPLSNRRTDAYGGAFANRVRLLLEVVDGVRAEWPERLPLFVRISATDWAEGGWDADQSVELARLLGPRGVDVVDCSSAGLLADAKVPVAPGYQVPFAARIRREAGIATAAVGLITVAAQADAIVREGQADLVAIARESLRNPHFPLQAGRELGLEAPWPRQYLRARP